jgi:hypothetical protein
MPRMCCCTCVNCLFPGISAWRTPTHLFKGNSVSTLLHRWPCCVPPLATPAPQAYFYPGFVILNYTWHRSRSLQAIELLTGRNDSLLPISPQHLAQTRPGCGEWNFISQLTLSVSCLQVGTEEHLPSGCPQDSRTWAQIKTPITNLTTVPGEPILQLKILFFTNAININ